MSTEANPEGLRPSLNALIVKLKKRCQGIWSGEHAENAPPHPQERGFFNRTDPKPKPTSAFSKQINEMLVESLDEFRTAINSGIEELPIEIAPAKGREKLKEFVELTKQRTKEVSDKIIDEKSEKLYALLEGTSTEEYEAALKDWEVIFEAGFLTFSRMMVEVFYKNIAAVSELSQQIDKKCDAGVKEVNAIYQKATAGH